VIGRKKLNIEHPKLKQVTGDLFEMGSFKSVFQDGDDLFIAIGTTRAKTPDKSLYEKIDFGIPASAAKLAEQCDFKTICVVSSMGANSNSPVFYSRLKGKMENYILNLDIDNIIVVRPSLLLGKRQETRTGESVGAFIMTHLDFLIPKKSKAIHGSKVAKVMISLANQKNNKSLWMNDELLNL